MKKLILLGAVAFLLYGTTSFAQTSTLGNGAIFGVQFLGFDGTGAPAKDLEIRNDFNRPINMYTNGIQRMKINGTNTQNIGVDTTNTDGYVGIGNY